MPHDDQVNDLRVGGWFREEPPTTALMPYRPRVPARTPADSERAHRVLLACGVAVVTGVSAIMALILTGDDDGPGLGPAAAPIVFPSYQPLTPVSLLPAPASSAPARAVVLPTRTLPVAEHTTTKPTPSRSPSAAPTTTPVVDLAVGSTVGLEIAGRPGVRLRHRNFVARADRIVSALDRADSAFAVRQGLARPGCVSLEAVNYPGYFLRHRNFVLRLEQRNRSGSWGLFDQDATFCPSPTAGGSAVILESINYPDRALHLHDDDIVHLDQGAGTAFVVRTAS
jgi:alpha-L-arabinofuranosidase B-like protein